MTERDLERFVDKPRWFEFRVVSKDAWMQILPEAAEDSIVLVTDIAMRTDRVEHRTAPS